MTTSFNSAVAGMAKAVQGSRGVSVTYLRGGDALPLTAVPAEDRYLADDGHGLLQQQFVRDYLLLAADLDFGAGPAEPQRGDRIKEAFGDTVKVYEVVALGGEPHWRYCDSGHQELRIHTKLIATEPA